MREHTVALLRIRPSCDLSALQFCCIIKKTNTDELAAVLEVLGESTAFVGGVHGQAFQFNWDQSSIVMLPVNIGPAAFGITLPPAAQS
jgi:hypothetical protein